MTRLTSSVLLLSSTLFAVGWISASSPADPDYRKEIFPLIKKYCGSCHGQESPAGGIPFASYADPSSLTKHSAHWEKAGKALAYRRMPPPGMPAPTESERKKLVDFIQKAAAAKSPKSPRVTIRRLNRAEYNNTIRDLFGIDLKPADAFPSDDVGYGFDNIGDVLSMSPLHMEKYMKAAQQVASAVIFSPGVRKFRISPADVDTANSNATEEGGRLLYGNGEVRRQLFFPVEGEYRLRVSAYQTKAGPEDAKLALRLNGKDMTIADVAARRGKPQEVTVSFTAGYGYGTIGAAFINDYYKAKTEKTPAEDRNLGIVSIEVEGPLGASAKPSPVQERILFVKPTPATRVDATRKILSRLATRAYRRPLTRAELDRLVAIAELAHKNGDTFENGIQLGIVAVLSSPNFLFRAETGSGGNLTSYEVASRLSYFLWSSMPDDELFELAGKNELQKPAILAAQVKRMLSDPKSDALALNFAGQWLQTRKLSEIAPDKKLFPKFTDAIRRSMATETILFFKEIARSDRSVLEFISADYSFVDGPLASLYGIPNVQGAEFRRVQLPPNRGGIVTQASVLTVTSNPTRTSPVKRGKWILENILGEPPPPPPPDVGALKDDKASVDAATIRERMEQHRKDPMCASCHVQMDGLGMALENFDAVGAWRDKDGRFDVEASGVLPDGGKFTGPAELRLVLMRRKDQFVRCLAEKMLTYAIGRGVEPGDSAAMEKIVKKVSDGEYKFSTLVQAIVESDPFRKIGEGR